MNIAPRPAFTATPITYWETSLAYALSTPAKSGGGDIVVFHSYPCHYGSEVTLNDPTIFTLHLKESLLHGFVILLNYGYSIGIKNRH